MGASVIGIYTSKGTYDYIPLSRIYSFRYNSDEKSLRIWYEGDIVDYIQLKGIYAEKVYKKLYDLLTVYRVPE